MIKNDMEFGCGDTGITEYWIPGEKVREYRDGDIAEIDTFKELKAIDKTYDV